MSEPNLQPTIKTLYRPPQRLAVSAWRTHWRTLLLLGVGSLLLRLFWVLVLYPTPSLTGGDGPFYLRLANYIATGYGMVDSGLYYPSAVVAPAYPHVLAILQVIFGASNVVLAARLLQVALGVGLVFVLFALGNSWHSPRVGLLAALFAALDLRLIIEGGELYTESLFIFALYLGAWLYWRGLNRRTGSASLAAAGAALGLAMLTRAVLQFLPLVWLLPLWFWQNNGSWSTRWRRFAERAAVFLAGCAVVVAPWVVRNWYLFKQPFLAQGAGYHFRENAESTWQGNQAGLEKIENLAQSDDLATGKKYAFWESALAVIGADPLGYVGHRLQAVVAAYAQPHGTVVLDEAFEQRQAAPNALPLGLKDAVMQALRGERNWGELLGSATFWLKVWIYLWHVGSIVLAVVYCAWHWRHWRHWGWLFLLIAYLSGVYALLLIIPRYLFPLAPAFLLLAAAQLVMRSTKLAIPNQPQPSQIKVR